jgi:cystathionine gamma-synthase
VHVAVFLLPYTPHHNAMTTQKTNQNGDHSPDPGYSTQSVHAGETRPKPCNSITDPIFCTATYTFADTQSAIEYVAKKLPREEYARYGNPGEKVTQRKLAALEGGEDALLYSSGMAAVIGLLMAKLKSGDEVVLFDECYHRTREICCVVLAKYGIKTHLIPAGDYQQMESAINPATRLLISESPTNPHLSVIDLERFAAIGRKHHVDTVIDSTIGTPFNQRPLEYGIDYVLHSCTKYLAGHNDMLGGAVIGSAEKIEPLRKLRGVLGNVLGPHSIFLLLRGLKTFALRMQRHNENGMAVAEFLACHPRVEKVYYPGLPGNKYYELAKRQMTGFSGLITFLVKDADARKTADVIDAVRIPYIGPSLGGVQSLIEQPMVMSYHDFSPEARRAVNIQDNMIRISCGIENSEDLIADLKQALER